MKFPAPAISIEATSVHPFPNVLQQRSPNGVTPTPMTVVQQPQPTMNVTQASTVNPPVITQSLPIITRTLAMPANRFLPKMTSWTFPTRLVQQFTQVLTVLPSIQSTLATSIPLAQSPECTVPTMPVTKRGTVYYV